MSKIKDFSPDKYKYVEVGNKVIAISTYAGKVVRGVAKCHPDDQFSLERGKELAAKRCNEKVARKRFQRAIAKLVETEAAFEAARKAYVNAMSYADDASQHWAKAVADVENCEENL